MEDAAIEHRTDDAPAAEAAEQLEAVRDGSWAALGKAVPSSEKRRHLRIRVADRTSGTTFM